MSEIVEDNREADARTYTSGNVRNLSRMELSGGGQIVVQGRFAYVGHQHGPEGTTILDISDPRQPKVVAQLMTSHPWSHSHKVRVVGDLIAENTATPRSELKTPSQTERPMSPPTPRFPSKAPL